MIYDAVIVGAGISGSFIGNALTQAGLKCVMLEAGRDFSRATYPRTADGGRPAHRRHGARPRGNRRPADPVDPVRQWVWRLLKLRSQPLLLTGDVKAFGSQWRISNSKLRRELGWTSRVSIGDGMDAALAYLRQQRAAN